MADIKKEISDFKSAVYGEEVRDSMVSLAEKLNREVETNTGKADAAAAGADRAAASATEAQGKALVAANVASTAAENADAAAENAENTRQDLLERLAAGEFKGEKGEQGETGPMGASGIMAPSSGMFSLCLDSETGNLYADYPDGETPPAFQYDEATGNLYYLTGEDVNG